MRKRKHLWEVDHPYCAAVGNYFHRDCHSTFQSWDEFMVYEGDSDMDYNLLYRFDWDVGRGDGDYNGVVAGKNKLSLFYMGQRKALARSVEIFVSKNDEPKIKEWLHKRWLHLKKVWRPFK